MTIDEAAQRLARSVGSDWRTEASCRVIPPVFFQPAPEDDVELQRAVCRACPSRKPCLIYALTQGGAVGFWGGFSRAERSAFPVGVYRRTEEFVDSLMEPVTEEILAEGEAAKDVLLEMGRELAAREIAQRTAPSTAVKIAAPAVSDLTGVPERVPEEWSADVDEAPFEPAASHLVLRPDQMDAVAAVRRAFASGDGRTQVVMACGTGKTLVGQRVAERIGDGTQLVLVAVPSLSLIDQTWRSWAQNAERPFGAIAVCSNDDLTADDVVDDVESIVAQTGMVVTTDPAEIAGFLHGGSERNRVVFVTYHSVRRIAEAFGLLEESDADTAFDLVICDEAHRTAGILDRAFTTVLDDAAVPARRRLFLTATPRRTRSKHPSASMDDEELYGGVVYELPFGEAIDRGLLADYQIVVVEVDDAKVLSALRRGAKIELDDNDEADPRHVATAVALLEAAREYDLRSVLAFHDRVADSKAFTRELLEVERLVKPPRRPERKLTSAHIDAHVPGSRRRELLDELGETEDGSWRVLSSVRTIAEGVDVPAVDAVAFVDPRSSAIEIVQTVGRALRLNPRRSAPSVVLVPIYVPPEGDPVDVGSFVELWQVLEALKRRDGTLAAALAVEATLAKSQGHPGTARTSGDRVELAGGKLVLPKSLVPAFLDSFRSRLVTRRVQIYERGLVALDRFIAANGHPDVPGGYVDPDGFELGRWVTLRRQDRRQGKLTTEDMVAFEQRGFIWGGWDAKFRRGIRALRRYRREIGAGEIPGTYVDPDGFPLGSWVYGWCNRHARAEVSTDRISALRACGVPIDLFSPDFEPGFAAMRAHFARGSYVISPNERTDDGFRLGLWWKRWGARYYAGELEGREYERLDEIGAFGERTPFTKGIKALRVFRRRNPDRDPFVFERLNGVRLTEFLRRERYEYELGRLAADEVEALSELGFDFAGSPEVATAA